LEATGGRQRLNTAALPLLIGTAAVDRAAVAESAFIALVMVAMANLARRATTQQYLPRWEAYMRMAMKAQSQCRMTLKTLANIKNPPAVFARQANINKGGQQQVNNGPVVPERASCARKSAIRPSKLLERHDVERLDTGAQSAPGASSSRTGGRGGIEGAKKRSR
jgi:hypothetical protein